MEPLAIENLTVPVWHCFRDVERQIDKLRSDLEDAMCRRNPRESSTDVFYPEPDSKRLATLRQIAGNAQSAMRAARP